MVKIAYSPDGRRFYWNERDASRPSDGNGRPTPKCPISRYEANLPDDEWVPLFVAPDGEVLGVKEYVGPPLGRPYLPW